MLSYEPIVPSQLGTDEAHGSVSSQVEPFYILGAGPTGMAAAYSLAKLHQPAIVVERDSTVGGLSKSIDFQGFILDYGPHFFTTDSETIVQFWDQILGAEKVTYQRQTRMYWRGTFFGYPPSPFQVLRGVGFSESVRILSSFSKAFLAPYRSPQNFSEAMSSKFGKRLFQVCFESYIEKLLGVSCTEIGVDWQTGRLRNNSLLDVLKNLLTQDDGCLPCPRKGSRQLYDRMATFLHDRGQKILLNHEVQQIHHENFKITHLTLKNRQTGQEETVNCPGVISSIPLPILLQQLSPAAPKELLEQAKSLKIRNTVLVYLIVETGNLFPDQCIYINDPDIPLGRVTNFANWSKGMLPNDRQTPLCCEYWCDFSDEVWQRPEADLLAQAEQDLRQVGLLRQEQVSGGFVVRLPRTHPVYAGNYKAVVNNLKAYLDQFQNLEVAGRYGAFNYKDQDGSLLMGFSAAEKLANRRST